MTRHAAALRPPGRPTAAPTAITRPPGPRCAAGAALSPPPTRPCPSPWWSGASAFPRPTRRAEWRRTHSAMTRPLSQSRLVNWPTCHVGLFCRTTPWRVQSLLVCIQREGFSTWTSAVGCGVSNAWLPRTQQGTSPTCTGRAPGRGLKLARDPSRPPRMPGGCRGGGLLPPPLPPPLAPAASATLALAHPREIALLSRPPAVRRTEGCEGERLEGDGGGSVRGCRLEARLARARDAVDGVARLG